MKKILFLLCMIFASNIFSYNESLYKSVVNQLKGDDKDTYELKELVKDELECDINKIILLLYSSNINPSLKKKLIVEQIDNTLYFDLTNAVFADCDFECFKFLILENFNQNIILDFTGSKFINCNFNSFCARFRIVSSDIKPQNCGIIFEHCTFENCQCRNMNLSACELFSSKFINCNLTGANFIDTDYLLHVDFTNSDLTGSKFSPNEVFYKLNIKNTKGLKFVPKRTNLLGRAFEECDLYGEQYYEIKRK